MFEKYSFADLIANTVKNKKWNLIGFIVLFLAMAVPLSLKTINSTAVVSGEGSYSSYIVYKIDAPERTVRSENFASENQYSQFYMKLISSNMTGPYLFNDVDSKTVAKIASEISSNETQLRNSDANFWEQKIMYNALGDSTGVSVKVLTKSLELNQLIEKKIDQLVNSYKNTFPNVTITKLDTVNSQEFVGESKTVSNFSAKRLVTQLVALFILAIAIVLFINFALYFFNPTLNRVGDFNQYGVEKVFEVAAVAEVAKVLSFIQNKNGNVAVTSSDKGLLEKLRKEVNLEGVTVIENNDLIDANDQKVVFVEELGIYSPKIEFDVTDDQKLKGSALVLDDSSTARKLVKDALEKMGLSVVEAKNGVEGLERMEELYQRYGDNLTRELRVILSDIEMPQMDGYRFASTIKNDDRFKEVPIVFNSSLSNEFSEIKSKEAGGAAYLTKFDASVFYQEVLKVIEAHSQSAK